MNQHCNSVYLGQGTYKYTTYYRSHHEKTSVKCLGPGKTHLVCSTIENRTLHLKSLSAIFYRE